MSGIRRRETSRRGAATAGRGRTGGARGFSVIELAVVLVILGLVIGPLLTLVGTQLGASRTQQTREALETARDALVAYAAQHRGCLPFAADFEGGLPDTDVNGQAGHTDVGKRTQNKRAGDLPWATLGLGKDFLDGDELRIQYYVAVPWTDDNASDPIVCPARFLGFEYNDTVTYQGSPQNPVYVYYTADGSDDRRLYKITDTYPPSDGPPPEAEGPKVQDITGTLDNNYLELRRGPDVFGSADEKEVVSARNVFVLIAAGPNHNPALDRKYVRDANHENPDGTTWTIQSNPGDVDAKILAATTDTSAADSADHGDDTMLNMSFTNFKAALNKFGLNVEPVCHTSCQ